MQSAAPGQILLEERLASVVARRYATEPLAPIRVRGKREPVAVVAVRGARVVAIRLAEPLYTLPLVGRKAALGQIDGHLARGIDGHGQIVGVRAGAGVGRAPPVARFALDQLADRRGTGAGAPGGAAGAGLPPARQRAGCAAGGYGAAPRKRDPAGRADYGRN